MTSPRHGSRDKMILQPILHCSHRIMTHCPISKVPSPNINLKPFQAREQQSPQQNTTPSEGVNITPNEGVVDPTYGGETVSADDPEVTWDSFIDEAIPATSKVSEGGDTLGMPGIINLQ